MIMVKPAMPYLNIIREARERFPLPLGAYQVSGEFSMMMAAINNGWLDRDRAILEVFGPAPRRLAALPLVIADGSLTVAAPFVGKVGAQQAG